MGRESDLGVLHVLLAKLRDRLGGYRYLRECTAGDGWPQRGVYFFLEHGEVREDGSPRVVRVGTHGLNPRSRTTLWQRLLQHRGTLAGGFAGGGNHRGSVFRQHVGSALMNRDGEPSDELKRSWGAGGSAPADVRKVEHQLEMAVSHHIGRMPFLWLAVPDPPGPLSDRGRIEASAIALLSNWGKPPVSPPSSAWLGNWASSERIRRSGLWNVNHTNELHDPVLLELLERYVEAS